MDRDLVALLDHYASKSPKEGRWRVVIAGDFIDFVGMSIDATDEITTALNDEEREHGLGGAADHARAKLRRVEARHGDVFDALARFLIGGHALTVVHGNHDIEFHWEEVRTLFTEMIAARARTIATKQGRDVGPDVSVAQRIEFEPWFFYWKGVAYIEHGHQYDAYCATENVILPVSPFDPRRIMHGFSETLLRFVVRQTHGLVEHGHEKMGIVDYVTFGLRLGTRGVLRLLTCFINAVLQLFRLRRGHLSETMRAIRSEHERRMALLSEAKRIGMDRLRAMLALQVAPITKSIGGILGSLLLDRIALGFAAILALLVTAIASAFYGHVGFAAVGVVLAWVLLHRHFAAQRKLDPAEALAARAPKLASLLPAAFVVMGHTHAPVDQAIRGGASRYINLGSWAEEEEVEGTHDVQKAARTHLVIEVDSGEPRAELRAWQDGEPAPYAIPPRGGAS